MRHSRFRRSYRVADIANATSFTRNSLLAFLLCPPKGGLPCGYGLIGGASEHHQGDYGCEDSKTKPHINTIRSRCLFDSGIDPASETYGSVLAFSPAKTLKLAMIFEVCRWLKDKARDWQVIQADTLDLSARHEAYCVAANRDLDMIATRAEIQNEADAILAQIRSRRCGEPQPDGHFYLTRTQLTNQFAANPGRHRGAMTPERLYCVIISDLIKRGLAKLAEKRGKLEVFVFRGETTIQQRSATGSTMHDAAPVYIGAILHRCVAGRVKSLP